MISGLCSSRFDSIATTTTVPSHRLVGDSTLLTCRRPHAGAGAQGAPLNSVTPVDPEGNDNMSWKPDSWEDFRRTYGAGDCRVEFGRNTMEWASRCGWRLEADLGQKRRDAINAFLLLSSIMIGIALFGGWSYWVPVIGVPVGGLICHGMATTPEAKDWEQAFIRKLLASEQDFWAAWEGSGIDLYRRGADGKYL